MKEYKKNLKKLALVLRGKRKTVLYSLKKEMAKFSKENNFEKAAQLRDRIMALENIMAHTKVIEGTPINSDQWEKTQKTLQDLLNIKKQLSKVECYDISNIQGKFAVGSMIVFIDGVPAKSQYKKFRIQMKNEPNDIAMLKEVFKRRLAHPEWSYPEVMLIDGGIAQLNAAINIKSDLPEAKNIKVISIAKGKRELLIEDKHEHIPLKELPQDIYNLIIHMDDEAHRFAITYHKKVRKQALLT